MGIFQKYKQEFDLIVHVTWRAMHGEPINKNLEPWIDVLYENIHKISCNKRNEYQITLEELKQELYCMWLDYIIQYSKSKPRVHLKTYLIRRSCWGLRDWYKYVMSVPGTTPFSVLVLPREIDEQDVGFRLDIGFLLYGTSFFPLSTLTPYQRYLIFLRYRDEKTILEMSYIVQKSLSHVKRELRSITNQLKELAKQHAEKNTIRSRVRGPRVQDRGSYSESESPGDSNTTSEDYIRDC